MIKELIAEVKRQGPVSNWLAHKCEKGIVWCNVIRMAMGIQVLQIYPFPGKFDI